MNQRRLDLYDNSDFRPGGTRLSRLCWYGINQLIFCTGLFPFYRLKILVLRLFGAKIGAGVVIKPRVHITYPWNLQVGDHCWIGEEVRIDSLTTVTIGSHICISQRAFLCTGSHDYRSSTFELIVKPITVRDGAWIGAAAILLPGVTVHENAVVGAGCVVTKDVSANTLVAGNPAVRYREIAPLQTR